MSLCWLVYWYEYNVRTMFVALSVLLDWILQTRKTPIITVIRLTADRETSISWIHWDPIKCPPPPEPSGTSQHNRFQGFKRDPQLGPIMLRSFLNSYKSDDSYDSFFQLRKTCFPNLLFLLIQRQSHLLTASHEN